MLHSLTDKDLLLLWENAMHRPTIEKGLLILAFSYPEYGPEQLAAFSIGDRDARLLQVRENLFGPRLSNTANCPQCKQKVEWEMPTEALKVQPINETGETKMIELVFEGQTFRLRLPNSADIMQLSNYEDIETQTQALIRKCMINADLPFEEIKDSEALMNSIAMALSEQDPQALIDMNLQCPECGQTWSAVFDIVQYLWLEIQERALRLIQDIYILASKFGWSEQDILSMSRRRRDLYLNMIQA